jgi:hypothetical protein
MANFTCQIGSESEDELIIRRHKSISNNLLRQIKQIGLMLARELLIPPASLDPILKRAQ